MLAGLFVALYVLCSQCVSVRSLLIWASPKHLSVYLGKPIELDNDATVLDLANDIIKAFGLYGVAPEAVLIENSGQLLTDSSQQLADAGVCAETIVNFSIRQELVTIHVEFLVKNPKLGPFILTFRCGSH